MVEILNQEQESQNREAMIKALASIPSIDTTKARKLCSILNDGDVVNIVYGDDPHVIAK